MDFNEDPHSLGVQLAEPLSTREIALALFTLLDDIDTADDIAKGDEKLYRNLVRRHAMERFKYATTDGYDVFFNTTEKETSE